MGKHHSRHDKRTDHVTPAGIASISSRASAVHTKKNEEDWFADTQLSARTGPLHSKAEQEQVVLKLAGSLQVWWD